MWAAAAKRGAGANLGMTFYLLEKVGRRPSCTGHHNSLPPCPLPHARRRRLTSLHHHHRPPDNATSANCGQRSPAIRTRLALTAGCPAIACEYFPAPFPNLLAWLVDPLSPRRPLCSPTETRSLRTPGACSPSLPTRALLPALARPVSQGGGPHASQPDGNRAFPAAAPGSRARALDLRPRRLRGGPRTVDDGTARASSVDGQEAC